MHCRTAIAAAALAAALTGCSSDDGSAPIAPGSPSTTKTPSSDIGKAFTFEREDTGATVGSITFAEVVTLPATCLREVKPGTQAIALRVEIDNTSAVGVHIPGPDQYTLTTLDTAGVTQPVESADLTSACAASYPEGASPATGRKTIGWVAVQAQPDPAALQYTPLMAEGSISDMKFVKPSPVSAKAALPKPLPAATASAGPAPTPAPTTTEEPEPTTVAPTTMKTAPVKAAPAAGAACDPDVDNWAKTSTGKQLKCAYAGGPTPKWVNSAPFIGTRQPGSRCSYDDGVAESPSGQTLVCTGERDSAVWTPGP